MTPDPAAPVFVTCPLCGDERLPRWASRAWWEHFDNMHRDDIDPAKGLCSIQGKQP